MQDPPHGRFKRSRTPVQTPSSRRAKPTPEGQGTATPGGRTSEFRTGSPALQASLPAPRSVGRGCFCKRYIGGANNLREADVIVMSSDVTKLFQFILYFLLIKTSFYSICLTENNVLECRFLLTNTVFYRLLQHNKIKLGYHN
jgi:hypothetical protein